MPARRRCGSIEWLPSGSARAKVYAGVDPVSGRELCIREQVKARRTRKETQHEAHKVLTKLLNQVDERRNPRTNATVSQLLDRWLDVIEVGRKTRNGYLWQIERRIRPTIGRPPVARLDAEMIDSFYAGLRRCRDHCEDPDWGTLVWLAMVTGARPGELSGVRWHHVDLAAGVVTFDRCIWPDRRSELGKATKTHQARRVTLDRETVQILREHRLRFDERAAALGTTVRPDGYVFSLAPDGSTPVRPDTITQRYSRLAKRLGIETNIHALRHYSATEFIAACADPRTVAGRLGHGGG